MVGLGRPSAPASRWLPRAASSTGSQSRLKSSLAFATGKAMDLPGTYQTYRCLSIDRLPRYKHSSSGLLSRACGLTDDLIWGPSSHWPG